MKTIALCMIVKNESAIIRQCLESARPIVDYVFVVDTGSTDGTQEVIRQFLDANKLQGSVIDEPWRDFGYNRSFGLARLRELPNIDYVLVIDADDRLSFELGFNPNEFKSLLTDDIYDVSVHHRGMVHHRPQLFRNSLPFAFKGVVHEYLEIPSTAVSRGTATGLTVRATTAGARSRNPEKYKEDVEILANALATESDPCLVSRYTFYLAQSLRDAGEKARALTYYLKRAELGFWDQEIYISLLEAGNLMASLNYAPADVLGIWEKATQRVPERVEALHAASRYCRANGDHAMGMTIARRGVDLPAPPGLFVQPSIYEYGLLDEFAVNAYWAQHYQESLDASLKLLASGKLPPAIVRRIAENARLAVERAGIAKPPILGSFGQEDFVAQHPLKLQRQLHSHATAPPPTVTVAILAKQKEPALPLYLSCIEDLDYPKTSIDLYIRTNNNTDRTEHIIREWLSRVGHAYRSVQFDASDVSDSIEQYAEHEWNATRFNVLARIRNDSLRWSRERGNDFYFVADVDNFIRRNTLRELLALNLPIVAPLLRTISETQLYSNYHADIDHNGYYVDCDQYYWVLNRQVRGLIEVPVVHCTYLLRGDIIPELDYEDGSQRHEYVVFSDSARKKSIPQYLDNRQIYGYITFGDGSAHHVTDGIEAARALLRNAAQAEVD